MIIFLLKISLKDDRESLNPLVTSLDFSRTCGGTINNKNAVKPSKDAIKKLPLKSTNVTMYPLNADAMIAPKNWIALNVPKALPRIVVSKRFTVKFRETVKNKGLPNPINNRARTNWRGVRIIELIRYPMATKNRPIDIGRK
jgi:hypothetical protein